MTARPGIAVLTAVAGLAAFHATCAAEASRARNPAVIELGDTIVSLDELDARFRVAARLLARRQGVPFAAQEPAVIERLRAQYLRKRATELVLLREAARRKVEIPAAEVQAAIAKIPPDGGDGFLEELAEARIADGAGLLQQIVRDEQTVAALTSLLLDEIEVPPGDVITFHHDMQEQLASPEQVCIRHVQLRTPEAAQEVRDALLGGADFARVAALHSTDADSAKSGGNLGCFARSASARTAFEQAAFSAEENAIVGPVASTLGYHVLQVYERKPRRVPTLNEAYDEIEDELAREQLPETIALLVTRSGVKTFPENLAQR